MAKGNDDGDDHDHGGPAMIGPGRPEAPAAPASARSAAGWRAFTIILGVQTVQVSRANVV